MNTNFFENQFQKKDIDFSFLKKTLVYLSYLTKGSIEGEKYVRNDS